MKILNLWERVIYALRAPEPGEFGFGISRDINDLLRSIHLIRSDSWKSCSGLGLG